MKTSILLFTIFLMLSCTPKKTTKPTGQEKKPQVSVVNYPLYYFTQRIAGDHAKVRFPVPANSDPAYWVPTEDSLAVFQSSDRIFTNGADYAKWLTNVILPERLLVNTSEKAREKYIEEKEAYTHSHGAEGEHAHTGFAITTWLDFQLALVQAEEIKKQLALLLPDQKTTFENNFLSLKADLLELDKKMKELASELDKAILGSHPVYQYLGQGYGIEIPSIHLEPDEVPSPDLVHELEHLLEHADADIMLWEGNPLEETKEIFKKMQIAVVVFSPCGNRPQNGDFLSVMQGNLENLENELRNKP